MNKLILLNALFIAVVMPLYGMKNDKKPNMFEQPKTLVKIIQTHYGADDAMNHFVENMFVYMQKNNPAMYKKLVEGIYSQQKELL